MGYTLKELAFALKDLNIKFSPAYNTEDAFISAINRRILEDPDISDVSVKTLRILLNYGFSLRYSDGKVLSSKDLS